MKILWKGKNKDPSMMVKPRSRCFFLWTSLAFFQLSLEQQDRIMGVGIFVEPSRLYGGTQHMN